MKLALFGGSGATGQAVIQFAQRYGCELSLHSRKASLANAQIGSISELAEAVVDGCDAVIICLGARPPYTDVFLADATKAIVSACQAKGVKRLICVTGALVGQYEANQGKAFRFFANLFGKKAKDSMADKAKQEDIVKASDLDWTIVKPPRLTNHSSEQHYIAGSTIHCGLFSKVSRKTLAYDIGKCLTNEATYRMVRFIKSIHD